MSNIKNVEKQVKKFGSYLIVIQRTLLVIMFSWIYVVLSGQNKYYKTIHQKVGLVLLLGVNF